MKWNDFVVYNIQLMLTDNLWEAHRVTLYNIDCNFLLGLQSVEFLVILAANKQTAYKKVDGKIKYCRVRETRNFHTLLQTKCIFFYFFCCLHILKPKFKHRIIIIIIFILLVLMYISYIHVHYPKSGVWWNHLWTTAKIYNFITF